MEIEEEEIIEEIYRKRCPRKFRKEKSVEDRKIENWVFDRPTLLALSKLMNKGYLKELTSIVSTGKEANVFRGVDSSGTPVAVKIYKKETALFKDVMPYIEGDPRFPMLKKKRRFIVSLWCQKEFKNLESFYEIGVRVPRPYAYYDNVIVMEFIGKEEAAPKLREVILENPRDAFEEIIEYIKKLYSGGFVHADLSEYNILFHEGELVFIDVSQGVPLQHPNAIRWLYRDIYNVVRYFNRAYGFKEDAKEYFREIVGDRYVLP